MLDQRWVNCQTHICVCDPMHSPRENDSLTNQHAAVYNASKAATHLYSETLRLELTPFNVKVLTVVTGAVATSFKANVPTPDLPPDSRYLPVRKHVEDSASGATVRGAMASDKYAEEVVEDVLSGATGKVWRGGSAGLAKFGKAWMPTWMLVSLSERPSPMAVETNVSCRIVLC
jgi:short-subunit dehydrogenase